jgi:hypothetical protein
MASSLRSRRSDSSLGQVHGEKTGDIAERLVRVEGGAQIRQLLSRYAPAVDTRVPVAFVALLVKDVDCGKRGRHVLETLLRGGRRHALRVADDDASFSQWSSSGPDTARLLCQR